MPLSRFNIVARHDPATLIRLLNYFAQLGMVPSRVKAAEVGGRITVRIEQPDLSEQQARIIMEKMQSAVLVEAVRVHRGRRLLTPPSDTIDNISA